MKPSRVLSTAILYCLVGAMAPVYAQDEKQDKRQEQAKPDKQDKPDQPTRPQKQQQDENQQQQRAQQNQKQQELDRQRQQQNAQGQQQQQRLSQQRQQQLITQQQQRITQYCQHQGRGTRETATPSPVATGSAASGTESQSLVPLSGRVFRADAPAANPHR